jgi:transcriptional regulator with XRE-family HTH domain
MVKNNIMKKVHQFPLPVGRALKKFGEDIRIARLKRGFTVGMIAERIGMHRSTYSKIEKGDPMVGLGAYATVLYILGFGTPLGDLVDQRTDDTGLLLNLERLPKRIRSKKKPQAS